MATMAQQDRVDTARSSLVMFAIALAATALLTVGERYLWGVEPTWQHVCWNVIVSTTGVGLVRWMTLGVNAWK